MLTAQASGLGRGSEEQLNQGEGIQAQMMERERPLEFEESWPRRGEEVLVDEGAGGMGADAGPHGRFLPVGRMKRKV